MGLPPITSMAARRAAKRAPKATGSRFEDTGWQLQNFVRCPFARLDWSCLCFRCSSLRRNDGNGGEGTFPRFGPRFPRFEWSAAANLDRLRIAIERIGPRYPQFERLGCMLRFPHSGDPFVRRSRFVWQPGRPRIARPAAANLDRLQIAIERGYGGEGSFPRFGPRYLQFERLGCMFRSPPLWRSFCTAAAVCVAAGAPGLHGLQRRILDRLRIAIERGDGSESTFPRFGPHHPQFDRACEQPI